MTRSFIVTMPFYKTSILILFLSALLPLTFQNMAKAAGDNETVINLVMPPQEWDPYYVFEEQSDTPTGLYPELLEAIFNELNWKVQYNFRPWKRAQKEVEAGLFDILFTVPTPQRKQYTTPVKTPVFRLYMYLYTYKGHPKLELIKQLKTIEDLKTSNLLLVTNRGNGWHKANIEAKGVETHYVFSDNEIAISLANKRADAMVDSLLPMGVKIMKLNLQDQIVRTDVRFGPADFHILVSKKSPFIVQLERINETIEHLNANGTLQEIREKYEKTFKL